MDPKPERRTRDLQLMRQLHLELIGEPCELCERRPGTQLDHILPRSRGGGDTRTNLRWVCVHCHTARHS